MRTGYAYQPPALGTYRRRRAACPQGPAYCTYWVRVRATGVPYVPRTVATQVLTGPSGASSPLRVSASRAVEAPEAVRFLRRFVAEDGKSVHKDVLGHIQRVCDAIEANAAARGGGGGGGAEGAPQAGEPAAEKKKKKKKKKDKDGMPTPTPSTPATLATPAAPTPAASATPAANGHANGTGGGKEAPSAVSGKKAKRDRPVSTPAAAAAGAATPAAGSGKKAKREKKKKDTDGAESAQKEGAAPNI